MSGLVGYDSSDEELGSPDSRPQDSSVIQVSSRSQHIQKISNQIAHNAERLQAPQFISKDHSKVSGQLGNQSPVPIGPVTGPALAEDHASNDSTLLSRYTFDQGIIMNLTLPPIPNFDIPESPPGSPDPAVVAKLSQFAQLKNQGVHFNERLASSTAVKNPNLLGKLLDSFDISSESQYATTLPASLWDPSFLPEWAYKEELAKAQAEAHKQRVSNRTGSVEFVPAAEKPS